MKPRFLIVLGLTSLLACASWAKSSDSKAANDNQNQKKLPVVVSITTVTFAESTGCWAKIFDGRNFTGRALTLLGDQSLANLEFPVGNDWEGDIDSLEVGPKAKLVLFKDENFADKQRALQPNEKVSDLHKNIFSEGVESLRLTCQDTQGSAGKAE
jgi:hypothetical protein